jgi:ribosomal protein L29
MSKLELKLKPISEIRAMDFSLMNQELRRLRDNQLKLRFLKKTQGFSNFDFFKKIKRAIAVILTVQAEKSKSTKIELGSKLGTEE